MVATYRIFDSSEDLIFLVTRMTLLSLTREESPMAAAAREPSASPAESDGIVEHLMLVEIDDAALVSEIESCHSEGVRHGDWTPCSLDDFVIALMRAGLVAGG